MPTVDLDELERLEKAATPGPWHVMPDPGENCDERIGGFTPMVAHAGKIGLAVMVADEREDANAALIAAARNAVPALIAELRAARSEIALGRAEQKRAQDEAHDYGNSDRHQRGELRWTAALCGATFSENGNAKAVNEAHDAIRSALRAAHARGRAEGLEEARLARLRLRGAGSRRG